MSDQAIFQVEDVFSIIGLGVIISGRLTDGIAQKGMKGTINGKQSEITAIESHNQSIEKLTVGVPAGLSVSKVEKSDIQVGSSYSFK